jgi:hypothetical protein
VIANGSSRGSIKFFQIGIWEGTSCTPSSFAASLLAGADWRFGSLCGCSWSSLCGNITAASLAVRHSFHVWLTTARAGTPRTLIRHPPGALIRHPLGALIRRPLGTQLGGLLGALAARSPRTGSSWTVATRPAGTCVTGSLGRRCGSGMTAARGGCVAFFSGSRGPGNHVERHFVCLAVLTMT